jgi:hypothetical protein
MNRELERPIEQALRDYGQSRVEQAAPAELHPATRAMLQAEVERVITKPLAASSEEAVRNFARPFATTPHQPGWLARFWPRLAFGGTVAAAFALVVTVLQNDSRRLSRMTNDSTPTPAATSPAPRNDLNDLALVPKEADRLGRAEFRQQSAVSDSLRAAVERETIEAKARNASLAAADSRTPSESGARSSALVGEQLAKKTVRDGELQSDQKLSRLEAASADKPVGNARSSGVATGGGAGGLGGGGFGGVAGGAGLARGGTSRAAEAPVAEPATKAQGGARGLAVQAPSGPTAIEPRPDSGVVPAGKPASASVVSLGDATKIPPGAPLPNRAPAVTTTAPVPSAPSPLPADEAALAGAERARVDALSFGFTPSPGSPAALTVLSMQRQAAPVVSFFAETAVGQQFTQEDFRRTLRRNFQSPPHPAVLENFYLVRDGDRVTITDADGSQYSGAVVPAANEELAKAKLDGLERLPQLKKLGELDKQQDQPLTAAASRFTAPKQEPAKAESAPNAWFFFKATGTNRTLNQQVDFSGSFYAAEPNIESEPRLGLPLTDTDRKEAESALRLKAFKEVQDGAKMKSVARYAVAPAPAPGAAPVATTLRSLTYQAGMAVTTNAPVAGRSVAAGLQVGGTPPPATSRVKGTAIIGKDRIEINATPKK